MNLRIPDKVSLKKKSNHLLDHLPKKCKVINSRSIALMWGSIPDNVNKYIGIGEDGRIFIIELSHGSYSRYGLKWRNLLNTDYNGDFRKMNNLGLYELSKFIEKKNVNIKYIIRINSNKDLFRIVQELKVNKRKTNFTKEIKEKYKLD